MYLRSTYLTVLALSLMLLCAAGCSTQKNTPATRAYHELTTRYNVYFNAEEAYNDALKALAESHKDNYHELLPLYPNSSIPNDTTTKQPGGPFDRTIEKTAKAIEEHSITAKPRRNPSQLNTQEYRQWLRRNEFNPFIDQAWLLMGKAHVQNQDYPQAISVLSQTERLFNYDIDVVSEAQLWMLRAYTEMGWFSDAETVANTLQARALPKNLQPLFAEFYAFLLLRQEHPQEAIPYLNIVIDNEGDSRRKRRLQFLLGQIYTHLGEKENAYAAFEKVKGLSTPYEVEFNAVMAQSQVATSGTAIIDNLQRMAKSAKNEEYLDQIYAAVGNIYLSQSNTDKAIQNYLLAEQKSTRNGIDKALAQVALGDIYFDRKEFVKAAPRYSDALGGLPKTHVHYPNVEFRAGALAELVPHISAIGEQDSLQHLAQLPQAEQLNIINAHIAELKKRDREQTRDSERDTYLAQQQARAPNLGQPQPSAAEAAVAMANRGAETSFYFYNPPLVAQGKSEFRRRWGNRPLQDNWRWQTATAAPQDTLAPSSSLQVASSPSRPVATDPYSAEFYLQQLPVSDEGKAESDKIIEHGLYEGGKSAKDRLEDFDYATGLFERHLHDFPQSDNRKDVYYHLYLMNMRLGNNALAQSYQSKIVSEFPQSEYAVSMGTPNYERVMRNFSQWQDSLYQQTYRAYEQGKPDDVHRNYNQALNLAPAGSLMPKFRLLNALSFAQTGNAEKLESALKELVQNHAEGEESRLAQDILDGLSEGKTLAANASVLSGINRQLPRQVAEVDTVQFSNEKNAPHSYLLLFSANAAARNRLLFAVSDFNFSNFQLRTFHTAYTRVSSYDALQIKPFRTLDEARRYAEMIESDSLFRQSIPADIIPLVISDANLELLNSRKSLAEYLAFTQDSIHTIAPIKEAERVPEPEKVVPLEPEKPDVPVVVPPKQTAPETIEQRQTELERKTEEALKQTENVLSPKERERMLKEREQARKEQIKQRERELKQKEKARREELKQRERERQQKLKEQEQLRKEKLKERERILRERNR